MQLNVIKGPTETDIVAHYIRARAELHSIGNETATLDLGTAICSQALSLLHDANQMVMARVPANASVEALWDEVATHFRERGTACLKCTFTPVATDQEKRPLIDLLQANQWYESTTDVLLLRRASVEITDSHRVISARAALKQYEVFAHAAAASVEPQLGEVAMLRLDDPRWDALVAIVDGRIVARAGVLSMGEIGLIENVRVLDDCQGKGFGKAVMQHAIDLCARSQFKHVILGCDAGNTRAIALYTRLGFDKVGESVSWFDPATRS